MVMGIVNVTPDSFSDGGKFFHIEDAIAHALKLEADGADILDIGGESSRPGSEGVTEIEEINRVVPVIKGIRRESSIPISVDTMKASVARAALDAGADMINDISAGTFDRTMFGLAAERNVPICLMHMKGTPKDMQDFPYYGDMLGEITSFLRGAIELAISKGVKYDAIIIDPGIGFGKTEDGCLEILKSLDVFTEMASVLIGTSRKSFIGKKLGLSVDERLEATLATIPACIEAGVSIIRVHDVLAARRFMDMYMLCRRH